MTPRSRLLRLSSIALAALAGAAHAADRPFAGHDSNAPVNYSADHIELLDRENRVILSGNVDVTQGDMRLRSQRSTVAFTNEGGQVKIQRLDASGDVLVTQGADTASGEVAVYDFPRRIITMAGHVVLHQSSSVLNGSRLVIDLNSGLTTLDGHANAGTPGAPTGGRVSGTFNVAKKSSTP